MVGRWWSRVGRESAGGVPGWPGRGTGVYCLTGIGIDRPRDAMERVAGGMLGMLRDVKSTPADPYAVRIFFPVGPADEYRVMRARHPRPRG